MIINDNTYSTQSYCDEFLGFCPITKGTEGELRLILMSNGHPEVHDYAFGSIGDVLNADIDVVLVDTTYVDEKGELVREKRWFQIPKAKDNKLNSREKMLIGMNEIIMNLNNEEAIDPWLMCGVPDGADEDEIKEMANDDNDFKYCVSLFLDIIRHPSAWDDGIYIPEFGSINANSRKEKNDGN